MTPKTLYSAEPARGWLAWGLLTPFLAILLVAIPEIAFSFVLEGLGLADARGEPLGLHGLFAFLVISFTPMGLVVLAWVWLVERRSLATIGLTGLRPLARFVRGCLIGMATIGGVVGAIGLAGGFEAQAIAPALGSPTALANMAILLACFALQASVEEVFFRGWLLSLVARKFNVPVAVAINAVVFAFLHLSRHQPPLVTLGTLTFGVFACCWALKAGNIWSVMGWHTGWNWLLAVGFELPVTGLNTGLPALLVRLVPRGGPDLTGGPQGPEGSYLCSLFFICASALLLWRMRSQPAAPSQPA